MAYVPNLRFKYASNWHINSLQEICDFYKGNGLSKSDLNDDGLPCILYGELYTTYKKEIIDSVISKTNTKLPSSFKSQRNDVIIPGSGEDPIDIAVARAIVNDDIILGGDLNVLRPHSGYSGAFLSYQLNGRRRFEIAKKAQGKSIVHLHNSDLKDIKVYTPHYDEQLKIVDFLMLIDQRIELQNKIIEDLELQKRILTDMIFKSFNEKNNGIIRDFIDYEQPTKYIVKNTDYVDKAENSVPVLTANQAFILGYTEDNEGIYNYGECILFDDFTMDLKYVDFPFKVKSSAIKILTPKRNVNIKYIYEYLKHLNFSSSEHKRHYISEIEVLNVFIPSIDIQNSKVRIIEAFNNKLKNEKAILSFYIREKNYLLNNLFI